MSQHISDITDGAKLVKWDGKHVFAVWHGGHTVNFYELSVNDHTAYPRMSKSIGDFETGEVTKQEVLDCMENTF